MGIDIKLGSKNTGLWVYVDREYNFQSSIFCKDRKQKDSYFRTEMDLREGITVKDFIEYCIWLLTIKDKDRIHNTTKGLLFALSLKEDDMVIVYPDNNDSQDILLLENEIVWGKITNQELEENKERWIGYSKNREDGIESWEYKLQCIKEANDIEVNKKNKK